ncbi:MAG: hypothetical protein Q4G30_07560 [Actinomycetaceae bacterium]|nr:hypothetical protein [Actinomycetaceae bacterium]
MGDEERFAQGLANLRDDDSFEALLAKAALPLMPEGSEDRHDLMMLWYVGESLLALSTLEPFYAEHGLRIPDEVLVEMREFVESHKDSDVSAFRLSAWMCERMLTHDAELAAT